MRIKEDEMKVLICIGSSCHVRGSRQVIETFTRLVKEHGAEAEIVLSGSFCMGACSKGVSVKIGDRVYHVKPEDAEDFFREVILEEAKK
ncbi:(2Fe-2S) ferredoxin domain-containing protein [Bariatricus sp. SGI.154]|uniref:(2Fe-2S) ferredoxin domain-containing protein n=1 Tax=Bariatricus sp. SGI.154 TaxID=3420549 RepID=UPI003D0407A7